MEHLDRNTVKYMIDELQEELDETKGELNETKDQLVAAKTPSLHLRRRLTE